MNTQSVTRALRDVIDPATGTSIADLGYFDDVRFGDHCVELTVGTTSGSIEAGQRLVETAKGALRRHLQDVVQINVQLAWNPSWSKHTPEATTTSTH